MPRIKICTEVVSEEHYQIVLNPCSCFPDYIPVKAGEKCHVKLNDITIIPNEPTIILFDYYVSMEYQFMYGYDYCILKGYCSLELPPGKKICKHDKIKPVSYTYQYHELNLTDDILQADIIIDLWVKTCEHQIISVNSI